MYCTSCGTRLTDDALFCPNCGVKVNRNTYLNANPNETLERVNSKSRLAAGLFGILLGAFGVHNFYLEYFTKAIIQVCLFGVGLLLTFTIIGAIIGIPMMTASTIWGFIEGILILTGYFKTDGKGNPMTDL